MTVWKAVQSMGKSIEFNWDTNEQDRGEADGTGVPVRGKDKWGKELKLCAPYKRNGTIKRAGVTIGDYHSGWDKLFEPTLAVLKSFKTFLLVTDGDTGIFNSLFGKVKVLIQRCLWHIPHQLKYILWSDKVKRKTSDWLYIMAEIMEICSIRPLVDDMDSIKSMVKSKTDRVEKLISFCAVKGYKHSTAYLENVTSDMFTAIHNRLQGKTTRTVERAMRTITMRSNVGKWRTSGALNAAKIRRAYYYNGLDAWRRAMESAMRWKRFQLYHTQLENTLRVPRVPQHDYNYEYILEWFWKKSDRSFLNEMKISLV